MDHIKDCAVFSEMIFAYAEESLGEKATDNEKWKELRAHLEVCETCREELSECEKMLRGLDDGGILVPEGLHEAIMSRVRAEAKTARRKRFVKAIGGVAAVFVIAVGVIAAFGSGAFSTANDMAADIFSPNGGAAPEAEYNGASDGIFDEADGDASASGNNQSKTESVPSDRVDVEFEAVETEAAEDAESPEPGSPETDASNVPDTTPENVSPEAPTEAEGDNANASDIELVMEDFILTTEYDGGVAYLLTGDGDAEVFDVMTDMSETDSYAWGEYFILLFDVSLLDDVDRKLADLADKYGAKLEGFTFGESESCVAIIIKR